MTALSSAADPASSALRRYNAFLLLVAGLGGLLYGIDVGIIGGALPYLEATSHLTAAELSVIVAAVLGLAFLARYLIGNPPRDAAAVARVTGWVMLVAQSVMRARKSSFCPNLGLISRSGSSPPAGM